MPIATSINVIEWKWEIGVLRALGTTASGIVELCCGEGIFLGMLSWLLAISLSVPAVRVFSYSASGVILWLAIVLALSALASLWPALAATRVSVPEALAYE